MIFVDTSVFVIALRYTRDRHARTNGAFLRVLADRGGGVTSIVNLLELCGILSFNLNDRQLQALFLHFARRFGVRVLPQDPSGGGVAPASPRKSEAVRFLEKRTGGAVTLGRFLEAVRLGEEGTQPEFAKKLGISRSHLNDIEKGRKAVSPERAARFARILGYSQARLVKLALQDLVDRSRLKLHVHVNAA